MVTRRFSIPHQLGITMHLGGKIFAAAMVLAAVPSIAEPIQGASRLGHEMNFTQEPGEARTPHAANELHLQEPETDLFAMMSGTCPTLKVAGHDFTCRSVAFAHSTRGRAYFTI